jgi:hypothetical protein
MAASAPEQKIAWLEEENTAAYGKMKTRVRR